MRNKLKLLFWLCLGAAATAVVVPLIAALESSRPLVLITENSSWIALLVAGAISVIALLAMRDKERTDGETKPQNRIENRLAAADPVSRVLLTAPWSGDHRRYSLSFICGAALAAGLIPLEVLSGDRVPEQTPTHAARSMIVKAPASADDSPGTLALRIDADRDGIHVVFDHASHQKNYDGIESCSRCHHVNKNNDRATPCFECHSDMLLETDVFSHAAHIRALDGQSSCTGCHRDPGQPKTRATATRCGDCHEGMRQQSPARKTARVGHAPGYAQALHASCIGCHATEGLLEVDAHGIPTSCSPCHPETQHEQIESSRTWEILKAARILKPPDSAHTSETSR